MKKVLVILLVMLSSSMVFAEVLTQSAVITAVKRGNNNGSIPNAEAQIRLVDAASAAEFGSNEIIPLPVSARNDSYSAFSWAYGGNFYEAVTITFTFKPMKKLNEELSLNGTLVFDNTKVLPYTVDFEYTSTRVGNSVVNINKPPTTYRTELAYWGENRIYYMAYADAITLKKDGAPESGLSTTASVTTSDVVIAVNADMSTKTVIYSSASGSTTVSKTTFENAFVVNNERHIPVCDHWVRSGYVNVTIDIDPTGSNWTSNTSKKVDDGVYYADVVIGFTKD